MKCILSFCVAAFGLTACAVDTIDSSGWSRDNVPVKGNSTLERQFNRDYAVCYGRNLDIYKDCMAARGYAQGIAPVAIPVAPAVPAQTSTISTDWRARATEARVTASQLQDPVSKRKMLEIAKDYDQLAAHQGQPTVVEKNK